MKAYLKPTDKLNDIRLALRVKRKRPTVWVLVEGMTDVKLFRRLLRGAKVESVPGGVPALRRLVAQLVTESSRVIGISDADFQHLTGEPHPTEGLFLTDAHDLEMTLLADLETFETVLAEMTAEALAEAHDLRGKLLNSFAFLSGLRYLSHTNQLELNFDKLAFKDFYSGRDMALDTTKCLSLIHQRSKQKVRKAHPDEVYRVLETVEDLFQLSNGHDFEKCFAAFANAKAGKSKHHGHEKVGACLRLAYTADAFSRTRLYQSLAQWEQQSGIPLFSAS